MADLFQRLGLLGTWAVDCPAAASPGNPRVTDLVQNGAVLERQDLGPDTEINYYRVVAAAPLSATRISVQVIFRPGGEGEERQALIWAVHNGSRRTLRNEPQDKPLRVKNGIAVGFGVKTPVLRKCSSDPLPEKVRAK
ncbi:MAG TPA: hypothetical protein VFT69_05140 [Pseudolabrys sp.]|nr:hypothetical protein [Pseudolabrys sp.]